MIPASRKILHMALLPIFTKIDIDLSFTIKRVSAIVTPNIFPKLHSSLIDYSVLHLLIRLLATHVHVPSLILQ